MNRRLVLRPEAAVDIDEAAAWYEGEATGLGVSFIQDLNVLLRRIEGNPHQRRRLGDLTVTDQGLVKIALLMQDGRVGIICAKKVDNELF